MRRLAAGAVLVLLAFAPGLASAQLYRRPVACDNCINYWYYKDQGSTQDWNCGSSTYADHLGSDYSLRGGNASITMGNPVVAMAAGTVVSSEDGYYDRCTQCGGANCGYNFGNGFANQVIINHGAYRVTYGHMRMGSIKVKAGDAITCGQQLGEIGSSGCSTGAHLHVEPRAAGARESIDPYKGNCSPTTTSLWVDQGAYRALPSPTCDGQDPVPVCPADAYPIWTCNTALTERRRCEAGVDMKEPCPGGCMAMPTGVDDVCKMTPDADADGSRADVDCNEMNAAIHPGAVDVCGDGVDQDCSGGDRSCGTGGVGGGGAGLGGAGGAAAGAGGSAAAGGGAALAGSTAPARAGQGGAVQAGGAGSAGTTGVQPGGPRSAGAQGGMLLPLPAPRAAAESGCAATQPTHGNGLAAYAALAFGALYVRGRRRTAGRA